MLSPEAELKLLMLRPEHEHLFFIGAGEFEAIIRPLTLLEVKIVSAAGEGAREDQLNDWIVEKCCLYATGGKDSLFTTAPAGIVDQLAKSIILISKFQSEDEIVEGLNAARTSLSKLENQIMLVLLSTFRNLSPKDVENMTFYTQMKYLALAEAISGKPIPTEAKKDKKGKKFMSPEVAAMLSKEAADKPDIEKDNRQLSQYLTGRERLNGRST